MEGWLKPSVHYKCYIKMKFGQVIVQLMTNMSDLFVALLGKLKTSYRLFYDFDKMALVCDVVFFTD